MLPVDIAQVRRQFFEQRDRHRTAADEGARFSARQNLALHQQFALLDFEAGGFQQAAYGRMIPHVEDARHAGARFPGAHHVGGSAAAQQQPQGVHHDGFSAAGFAGQQVEAAMEVDAQALHHGIVFHHQLLQHACDYNVGVAGARPRLLAIADRPRLIDPPPGAGRRLRASINAESLRTFNRVFSRVSGVSMLD